MLTLNQIIDIYRKGVEIKFKRKSKDNRIKGEYDPSTLEAIIYVNNNLSNEDKDITILHELIHARDDIKGKRLNREKGVEREAIETYKESPEILEFIKALYKIK